MAVSVNTGGTYTATRVDSADTATNWAVTKIEGAGGAPSLLASVGTIDLVAEGTDARAARTNKQRVKIAYTHSIGYDFTSGGVGTGTTKIPSGLVYVWAAFLAAGIAFTKANGGGQISLSDGTNVSYWNVFGSDTYSGGLVKWAVSTAITPSETSGTAADLGDITEIGFVTDVGGATARFDNFVVDALDVGDGLSIQGTTATDKLFAETVTQDELTAIGIVKTDSGIVFSQGSLEFSGTAMTSDSETLVLTDTLGGAYTYNIDVTGTVDFVNSSISAAGAVDYNFDSSGATSFSMTGGGLSNYLTLTTGAAQAMSGAVFQAGGTAAIANDLTDSAFNQCGAITLTGSLAGVVVDKNTAASAVLTDDLGDIAGCTFTSDGTGQAVELTVAGASTPTMEQITTVTSSTGTVTLPAPTTINDGDDLVVVLATDFSDTATNTYTAPAGWTSLTSHERLNSGAAGISTQAFIKKASGESGADYDFLESASRSTVGFLYRVSGGNALTPVNASSYVSATTGEPQAGTMTTTVDNALILGIAVWDASKTYVSSPSGYTSDATIAGRGDAASKTLVSAGATGTALWDISSGTNWKAYHIAIGGNTGSISGTMSWDNTDSDYAGVDGSTGNETIYVNVASGALTINVASGATTPTIRTAGATVTVVSGQATLSITVKDINTAAVVVGARVLITVADGTNFPYQESVTLTSVGTTATVTHTGHGLTTGDDVWIDDANEGSYNGAFSITVTDANTYTYVMDASTTSPATGTITSTLALINDITDGTGTITDTRSYNVAQSIEGRVRKSSATPYYKTSPITGTVDNANGASITSQLIPDE